MDDSQESLSSSSPQSESDFEQPPGRPRVNSVILDPISENVEEIDLLEEEELVFRSLSKHTPSHVQAVSQSLYTIQKASSSSTTIPTLTQDAGDYPNIQEEQREEEDSQTSPRKLSWFSRWFSSNTMTTTRHVSLDFRLLTVKVSMVSDSTNHSITPNSVNLDREVQNELKSFYQLSCFLHKSPSSNDANADNGDGDDEILEWTVFRRLRDFVKLHSLLTWRHVQQHLSMKIPSFPKQILTSPTNQGPSLLQDYLMALFAAVNTNNCMELCEFCDLSGYTLKNFFKHGKEGYLKLKIYTNRPRWQKLLCACLPEPSFYRTRWVIFHNHGLIFLDSPDQDEASDVFTFDHLLRMDLKVSPVKRTTSIVLTNASRRLELKPASKALLALWIQQLAALHSLPTNPFFSFAQIHGTTDNNFVRFFVDARDYYDHVATAMDQAKRELFIMGWWISPELYLRRPAAQSNNEDYRLDRLLKRKAEQGVNIYIVVFKELAISLPLDSAYTKVSLQRLHPNIKVQRHPDHAANAVLYWAHHEKVVVVDQQYAFLGGMDLCYGRFDDARHVLNDWYPSESSHRTIWPGMDYSNPRIREFRNVATQYAQSMVDRRTIPRLPWHDVCSQLQGPVVTDMCRHFVERWNFVKNVKAMHKPGIPFLVASSYSPDDNRMPEGFDKVTKIQLLRQAGNWSHGLREPERSVFHAMKHLIENAKAFVYIENQFFVSHTLSTVPEYSIIQNNFSESIVKRIIRAHQAKEPFKVIIVIPLIPAFESTTTGENTVVRMIMQAQYSSLCRGRWSIVQTLKDAGIEDPDEYFLVTSLRAWDVLNGRHVTEQVYVHSKLMIVDDCEAIIGSANVNDRSLLGFRDSEIAAHIECPPQIKALRMRLWAEHLGMLNQNYETDLDNAVKAFELIRDTTAKNTQIFRELFHCIPDDTIATWGDYAEYAAQKDYLLLPKMSPVLTPTSTTATSTVTPSLLPDRMQLLGQVKGTWVRFSLGFLRNEDLLVTTISPEAFLPMEVFI